MCTYQAPFGSPRRRRACIPQQLNGPRRLGTRSGVASRLVLVVSTAMPRHLPSDFEGFQAIPTSRVLMSAWCPTSCQLSQMDTADHHLCQLYERSVSRGGAHGLYPYGGRHHALGTLAHIPGADQTCSSDASVIEWGTARCRPCASYLVGGQR
jgi:hypothetical protein